MMIELNDTLVDVLAQCRRLTIFTGAGVSAESGIRTFRDEMDGLWKEYSVEDVVSIDGFERNPSLVWRWHEWFRGVAAKAMPNPAHRAIAAVSELVDTVDVITQNIDGLHQRAGSRGVIELHGNINRVCCSRDRHNVDHWMQSDEQPRCADCGAVLRHDIVWFGEMLPDQALSYAMNAAAETDVLLAIGTSSVVYPAAQIPYIARQHGARVVVVNPESTPLTQIADDFLQGPAGQVLPVLFERVWGERFTSAYALTSAT